MDGLSAGRRAGVLAATACGLGLAACGPAAGSSMAAGRRTAPVAPFVYVANKSRSDVSQFGSVLGGSGALGPLAPRAIASGPVPVAVAVSPQGDSAYVVDAGPFSPPYEISQYHINPATGKLTPLSPRTVPTGLNPTAIAVTPDGKNVYVADFGTETTTPGAI